MIPMYLPYNPHNTKKQLCLLRVWVITTVVIVVMTVIMIIVLIIIVIVVRIVIRIFSSRFWRNFQARRLKRASELPLQL